MQNLKKFLKEIPKADLHSHLDGSIRPATLIDLSIQQKLALPSYTKEGLDELVFKERYQNLQEYLQGFAYTVAAMQAPENLARISYEFALDSIADGVFYVEVRFAPYLHVNSKQDLAAVLLSVNRGLNKAKQEHNLSSLVITQKLPEFNYGIIACAMRSFSKGCSEFYDQILATESGKLAYIFGAASLKLVQACIKIRDKYALPLVAFDLAGEEEKSPPIVHKKAYHFARQNFLHTTVHAGEATGPETIFQAVVELCPERIGHGYHLFAIDKIIAQRIKNKNDYIEKLVSYLADHYLTIEVCLTSNFQTLPQLTEIKNHPLGKMLAANLSVVICTDNRTISKTSLTKELALAVKNFNLDQEALRKLVLCGFKRSFYPGTRQEKENYLAQITRQYDLVRAS